MVVFQKSFLWEYWIMLWKMPMAFSQTKMQLYEVVSLIRSVCFRFSFWFWFLLWRLNWSAMPLIIHQLLLFCYFFVDPCLTISGRIFMLYYLYFIFMDFTRLRLSFNLPRRWFIMTILVFLHWVGHSLIYLSIFVC